MIVRPSSRSLIALLLGLWQISTTAIQTFGWGAVRAGAIDLRRFDRGLRTLAIVALGLLGCFLLGTLFGDTLRVSGPLIMLENDSTATRPLLVPLLAVPLTFVGLIIGWSMLLAGAATAGRAIRWTVLVIYMLVGVAPLAANFQISLLGPLPLLAAAGVLLALLALYAVQPLLRLGPVWRWIMFVFLHTTLTLLALGGAANLQTRFSSDMTTTLANSLVQAQFFFIVPFLVLAGLGWAEFALDVTHWTEEATALRAGDLLLALLLLALLGGRTIMTITSGTAEPAWGAWAGALVLLVGLVLIARVRPAAPTPLPRWPLIVLALALPGLLLVLLGIAQVAFAVVLILPVTLGAQAQSNAIAGLTSRVTAAIVALQPLDLGLVGAVIAAIGWRRAHATLARFGLIVAWGALLGWFTQDGYLPGALQYEYAHVDQILTPVLFGLTLLWLARGQLTRARALDLLSIGVLLALLNQTAFLDNPFSPVFGFAGVGFLVFGIVWNVVTAGGNFINRDTPRLASSARLLLYLGYVLLSVAVVHWYVASHNIESQLTQARLNESGFLKIGLPLIYLALIERGAALWARVQAGR